MKEFDGKVLVLGNDNRSFLTVSRSLGRKNICVHVGWCKDNIHALKSKYIIKKHNIPAFSLVSDDWKQFFINLLKSEHYDLVIPCNDSSIIPLQLHRKEFEQITRLYLLEDYCYKIANDKFKMQQIAKLLGVCIAKECKITNLTSCSGILSKFNLPVVIKPKSSYTKEKIFQKRNVFKIYEQKELEKFIINIGKDEYVAQKNFIGKGAGIEILAKNGNILTLFQHVRIHEPLTGGGSSYRMSVKPFDSLVNASQKIIKYLNYTGVAMIEYKYNPATMEWIFIEINARFWGSLPLPVSCGIDFPYFLYLMLTENRIEFNTKYQEGLFCRNTTRDLQWMINNIKANRKDQTLATRPLGKVFLEILNILLLKERNDTLVIDDFAPGLAEIKGLIKSYSKKIFKKAHNKVAQLFFIRLINKKKAIQLYGKSSSVLFICKGNICRSPFAHAYLANKHIPNLEVDSCGYFPKKNRPSPPEAINAAQKNGIDLSLHRSKIVNKDLIKKSDIIFVFDLPNYEIICERFKFAKNKIFMISSLNHKMTFQVKDPYGQDINYFSEIYKTISLMLLPLANRKK